MSALAKNHCVALALSGGIDSAVAALLLKNQGYDIHGFYMKHPYQADDETDARTIADSLHFPLDVIDVTEAFETVVENFTHEYFSGRTPNPCVYCNRMIKFGIFFDAAVKTSHAAFFSTGHYAQIQYVDGEPELHRGVDEAKDQSYVLYGMDRNRMSRLLFPLGHLTKNEVRRLAKQASFPLPDKKESQDICFIPSGTHSQFLHARRPNAQTAGRFVSPDGQFLALHGGFEQFTIGQRKGMGIGFGERVFVTKIDATTNDVVIGPWENLAVTKIDVTDTRWLLPETPRNEFSCQIKVRYRSREAAGTVIPNETQAEVHFAEPIYGVAPGQSAVFYDGTRVLGGGIISGT